MFARLAFKVQGFDWVDFVHGIFPTIRVPVEPRSVKKQIPISAPIESGRNNYLHAALGVPYLEGAERIPKGTFSLRFRSDHAKSEKGPPISGASTAEILRAGGDFEDYYLGTIREWLVVESTYGLTPRLEVRARIGVGGWDGPPFGERVNFVWRA